jgi:hypothetical protein
MAKKKTKMKVKSRPAAKPRVKPKAKRKRIIAKGKSRVSQAARAAGKLIKTKRSQVKKAVSSVAAPPQSKAKAPGYQWINAALTVRDFSQAIDFYQRAFGFQLRLSMPGPDGKIIHAELEHNGSVLMLGPDTGQMGAPQGAQSPVTIYTYV